MRLYLTRGLGARLASLVVSFFLLLFMLPVIPAGPASAKSSRLKSEVEQQDLGPNIPVIPPGAAYRQTNFISDIPGLAPILDPLLVNPWGISMTASSPFWVANNGTMSTQLIRGDVSGAPVVLNASPQTITIPGGLPTGTVSNPFTDFIVTPPVGASAKANFIFASETGNITAWIPILGNTAQIVASHPDRVYKGLAIGSNSGGNRLYAADFASGKIDIYDGTFALTTVSGNFADPTIPNVAGNIYHPFNIQAIGSSLYVMYAKVGIDGDDEAGIGNGYVRRFNTDGVRDLTFGIDNGPLNSPWGCTVAPGDFGLFSGALLVGNFGEGNPSIHAFNVTTGALLGELRDESDTGIVIDELWALQVGNGGNGGDINTVYFTAGPAEEKHGLFGKLKQTTVSATSLIQFSTDEYAIGEGSGHIDVTITRSGDASGSATVNYNTFDETQAGHASQKSDYEIALGSVSFAPGETSKTFRILVVNDNFVEGDEAVSLALSNPTGTGVGLGSPNTAEVTITDNDAVPPTTNPIDDAQFFVRAHYLDFLNREPDTAGFNFWVNQITSCGSNAACIADKRINVSAAFFLSIEFQQTGVLAYLTHQAAFGNSKLTGAPVPILYGEFQREVQALQKNFIFGTPGADAQLEANKQAYFNAFVNKPEFISKYDGLSNAQYVDNLLSTAGLSTSNFIVNITNSQEVPPTNPTLTGGSRRPASYGTATFSINSAETAMTFFATVNNVDLTGSQTSDTNDNLVNAHIHAGASVAPGVNGPVVWGFFGTPFNETAPNDQVVTPFVGGVGGTISGKWDTSEGNGATLTAQLPNIKEGRAYINFHTTQFGGGELRGNFPVLGSFRDSLVAGLNATTDTRATVLRKVAELAYLNQREINSSFVTMEYFGYLRRDPDPAGFNFWLKKLNDFGGNFITSDMVKAFITSSEYRQRFGP